MLWRAATSSRTPKLLARLNLTLHWLVAVRPSLSIPWNDIWSGIVHIPPYAVPYPVILNQKLMRPGWADGRCLLFTRSVE